MNRRDIVGLALAGTTVVTTNKSVLADFFDFGNGNKQAWVKQPTVIPQECLFWCWAASISMIFTSLGHFVDQKVIVQQALGGSVDCVTAPSAISMARLLSRPWTDSNGVTFNSRVSAAYDAQANEINLSNTFLVNELVENRPLLYANRHHAMVVVGIDYIDSPNGPVPWAFGVLDPWPPTLGFRKIFQAEIVAAHRGGDMMFLAAVQVT